MTTNHGKTQGIRGGNDQGNGSDQRVGLGIISASRGVNGDESLPINSQHSQGQNTHISNTISPSSGFGKILERLKQLHEHYFLEHQTHLQALEALKNQIQQSNKEFNQSIKLIEQEIIALSLEQEDYQITE
jgi:hypothetical protein